jgi:hypothetical protein
MPKLAQLKNKLLKPYFKQIKFFYVFAPVVLFVLLFQNPNLTLDLLKTSSLTGLKHAPFDGTSYPFSNSFLWTEMDSSDWSKNFNQVDSRFKIEPLTYDPNLISRDLKSLGFDKADMAIRNLKVSYPVVYMGTYLLDGKEGLGAHPAIDVKLPMNTPILSIANGVVTKVENQEYGFGNHIVIKHHNVPSLNNPGTFETIHSSYSHLSTMNVKVGDLVTKGQTIALSGDSGLSSTPHLHFQIDLDNSPWHPYWPFTGTELSDAGLDFMKAVNTGFKKSEAYQFTINPLAFVQKFENFKSSTENQVIDEDPTIKEEVIIDLPIDENIDTKKLIEITGPKKMILGESYTIFVKNITKPIVASANLNNYIKLNNDFLINSSKFENGILELNVSPKSFGELNINLEGLSDDELRFTSEVHVFKDIQLNDDINTKLVPLVSKKFISGFPDGSFFPDNLILKSEMATIMNRILKLKDSSKNLNFEDITKSDWYYQAVSNLTEYGVFNNVKSFNPANNVTYAELLKILFKSYKVDINLATSDDSIADYVEIDNWAYPYLLYGLKSSILNTEQISKFDHPVTRREFINILSKFSKF